MLAQTGGKRAVLVGRRGHHTRGDHRVVVIIDVKFKISGIFVEHIQREGAVAGGGTSGRHGFAHRAVTGGREYGWPVGGGLTIQRSQDVKAAIYTGVILDDRAPLDGGGAGSVDRSIH